MGRVKESGGGGFRIKNATEAEFYAESGEIASSQFLEFVRSGALYNGPKEIAGPYYYISITNLTDTRVLVYYSKTTTGSKTISLFEIIGADLKLLHTVAVATTERGPYNFDIERISGTQAILTYVNDQNYLCGRVVTMSGNSISLGTAVTLSSVRIALESGVGRSKIAVMSPTKIALIHRVAEMPGREYYLIIISVSGPTITVQKRQVIATIAYTGYYYGSAYSAISRAGRDKLVVMFVDTPDDDVYYLKAFVVNITDSYAVTTGTAISLVNNASILSFVGNGAIMLKEIDETHVLATYLSGSSSTYQVIARVLTISGTSLSAGGAVATGLYAYGQQVIDAVLFDHQTIVLCGATSSSGDWDILCKVMAISGSTLTIGITYNLGYGNSCGALALAGSRFLVLGTTDSNSGGKLYYDMPTTKAVNVVKPYVSSVWGVSKTKGTALKPGKAFLPKA